MARKMFARTLMLSCFISSVAFVSIKAPDEEGILIASSRSAKMSTREINSLYPATDQVTPIRCVRDVSASELTSKKNDSVLPFLSSAHCSFDALRSEELNALSSSVAGAVGPEQYLVVTPEKIRTFDKQASAPDGILESTLAAFFHSVRPEGQAWSLADVGAAYDRHAQKWVVAAREIHRQFPCKYPGRILLALSNEEKIGPGTDWNFFAIELDNGENLEYLSLGYDKDALYLAGNLITASYSEEFHFSTGICFVIPKHHIQAGKVLQLVRFENSSMYAPQPVTNFDTQTSAGYFISVASENHERLILQRVLSPDTLRPLFSSRSYEVPSVSEPIEVSHKVSQCVGAFTTRLSAPHFRNGHIFTAHTVGIDQDGTSNLDTVKTHNGCRWYEIDPASRNVVQLGTLYTPSVLNDQGQRHFFAPGIMTDKAGNLALVFSTTGSLTSIDAGLVTRMAYDRPGTLRTPVYFTESILAYNPEVPALSACQSWNMLSSVSIDPVDDTGIWVLAAYSHVPNVYAYRVLHLSQLK